MEKTTQVISVRLPKEMHQALVVTSDREQRSLNGQIIYLLAKALNQLPQEKSGGGEARAG